jgi:hypothetical protein
MFFCTRAIFFILPLTLYATESPVHMRSAEVTHLTSDQKEFYQKLAETYAPTFYADQASAPDEYLNSGDAILSPYFDGDEDWSNNPIHILELNYHLHRAVSPVFHLKAQALYSIIESKTYFYISYIKYNALDTGPGAHGHDSEVVWVVVKKTEKPFGQLAFVVTSAHGFPRIYSPDASYERVLRHAQFGLMKWKQKIWSFSPWLVDRFAFTHEMWGRPEFRADRDGEPRGLNVFVAKETHALYKCNSQKWNDGAGHGTIYEPVVEGQESETNIEPVTSGHPRHVGYSLINLDRLMLELYPADESTLTADQLNVLYARRAKIFEGRQNPIAVELADGTVQSRPSIPIAIAHATFESRGEARLANDWSLKTRFKLALPHLVHRAIDPTNNMISDEYIFNTFIEFTKVAPETEARLRHLPFVLAAHVHHH